MFDFLRGRALSIRLREPVDEFWDRRLGVHTFGHHPGRGEHGRPGWGSHYQPISYPDLLASLRRAGVGRESVFTDLGCGLGRGIFAAAWLGARQAIGVELVPELAARAETNRRRSRLRTRDIRIVNANALDHPLGETSHVYFFHTFGPDVIVPVFERARAERRAAGIERPLRLIYANPVHDDTIAGLGWFRRIDVLPARSRLLSAGGHYDFAIWESID